MQKFLWVSSLLPSEAAGTIFSESPAVAVNESDISRISGKYFSLLLMAMVDDAYCFPNRNINHHKNKIEQGLCTSHIVLLYNISESDRFDYHYGSLSYIVKTFILCIISTNSKH